MVNIKNYLIDTEPEDQSYIGVINVENINRLMLSDPSKEINEISEIIDDTSNDTSIPTDLAVKNYVLSSVGDLIPSENLGFQTDWLGVIDGMALNNDGTDFNNGLYYIYLSKSTATTINLEADINNRFRYVTFDGQENIVTTRPACSVQLAPSGAYITTDNTSWFDTDNGYTNPSSCVDHFKYSAIDIKNMTDGIAIKIGNEISPIIVDTIEMGTAYFVDPISYNTARGGWINCDNNLIPDNSQIQPNTQYELLRINSIFIDIDDDTSQYVLESSIGAPFWGYGTSTSKYKYGKDGYWYRYNGTSWIKRPKAWFIGAVACDSTKIVAVKCVSPKQIINDINNIKLEKVSDNIIRTKNITSYVSVFGSLFESKNQYLEWDLSSVLDYPQIFLYIDRTGRTIASSRIPLKSNNGNYVDQHNYWRCVGWCIRDEFYVLHVYDFNGSEPYTTEYYDKITLNSSTPNINRTWVKPMLPNKIKRIKVTCCGSTKVGFNYHQVSDDKDSVISGVQTFWNYKIYNQNGDIYTAVKEFDLNSLPPTVAIYFEDPTNDDAYLKIEYIEG